MRATAAESLVQRVERLERENRRWKRMSLAAVVVVGVALALAPAAPKKKEPPPKPVKASEVQVVDGQGVARISLKLEANGDPVVSLAGADGSGIRLALGGGRPELTLSEKTRGRAVLAIDKDGASLDLDGPEAQRTVRLQAGAALGLLVDDGRSPGAGVALVVGDGEPSLTLSAPDESAAASVTLQVSAETGPLVAVTGGLSSAKLGVSREGDPAVIISDATGRDRAVLGVTKLEVEKKRRSKVVEKQKTEPSSLCLFDADETVVWKAP